MVLTAPSGFKIYVNITGTSCKPPTAKQGASITLKDCGVRTA